MNWKDMEVLMTNLKVVSQHFPGGVKGNHKKPQSG
jgi:hypothetical protein